VPLVVAGESRTEHQENDLHESSSPRAQNASSETRDGLTAPGLQLIAPAPVEAKAHQRSRDGWSHRGFRARFKGFALSSRHSREGVAHDAQVNSVALGNGKVYIRRVPEIFGVHALRLTHRYVAQGERRAAGIRVGGAAALLGFGYWQGLVSLC
jgi:hypothetical protein